MFAASNYLILSKSVGEWRERERERAHKLTHELESESFACFRLFEVVASAVVVAAVAVAVVVVVVRESEEDLIASPFFSTFLASASSLPCPGTYLDRSVKVVLGCKLFMAIALDHSPLSLSPFLI